MPKFDAIWISNRLRFRKTLTGTRLTKDPNSGFLEPVGRDGFTARDRKTFIARFKICRNKKQICKSIDIDMATLYDAIAIDEAFRVAINECEAIEGRSLQLSNKLEELRHEEQNKVINALAKSIDKYGKTYDGLA